MADFNSQLTAFVEGRITADQLQQALAQALSQAPASLKPYQRALDAMLQQNHLDPALYQALQQQLAAVACAEGDGESDDVTRVQAPLQVDDQTRMLTASRPSAGEDRTQVRPVASEDQTRFTPPSAAVADETRFAPVPEPTQATVPTATQTVTHTTDSQGRQWQQPFDQADDEVPLGIGSVLKERFRLVEFVGAGGMGDVYKAEDSRRIDADDADPLVAVKVLNRTFRDHPESLRALQREARKSQNLAHPNIINVFDFDRDQHQVFMTMELMKGHPLNEAIKQHPQGMPLDQVMRYVEGMAEALAYAHQSGVIHSDFKPSNVFVHQGVIKVFDFGIARAAKTGQEVQDSFDAGELGALTPTYASPEMLDSQAWDPDPRDDIYALGCITYELLTGRHPFFQAGKKLPANEAAAQGLKPQRVKSLSRSQWQALAQSLAFERAQRIRSVKAFLEAFLPAAKRGRRLNPWVLWPSAAVLAAGAAYLPLRETWDAQRVTEFAEVLASGDEAAIAARLNEIEGYDPVDRDRYFGDVRVKEALTEFFLRRFEQRVAEDQYTQVDTLMVRAGQIYQDSRRIADRAEEIRTLRAQRLNQLNAELNQLLNADATEFVANYVQLQPLLETIAKVDRESLMLSDPRAPVKYLEAAASLRQRGDIEPALAMLAVAQQQFPGDEGLTLENKRLQRVQERQQLELRITELQQRVAAWSGQSLSLAQLEQPLQQLRELLELDSLNRVAVEARRQVAAAVEPALQSAISAFDWQDAEQLLERYRDVLDLRDHGRLARHLGATQGEYLARQDALLHAVAAAAHRGALEDNAATSVPQLLARLELIDPAPEVRELAGNSIANGYLRRARIARSEGQWAEARDAVHAGLVATGDSTLKQLLEQERGAIEAAASGSGPTAVPALGAAFDSALAAVAGDWASATDAMTLLDQLEQHAPTDPLLVEGRRRLAERLVARSGELVDQQRAADALALLRQGVLWLPEVAELAAAIEGARSAQAREQQQQFDEGLLNLKQELLAIAEAKELTPAWGARLLQRLAEFEAQPSEPEFAQTLRRHVGQAYLDHAQMLRLDQEFEAALAALEGARRFDPALLGLDAEREAVAQAAQRFQLAQAEQREKAMIAGLKQSLITQTAANDVRQASQTLAQLAAKLDSNDPFIRRQAPDAFVGAYVRLAEQQASKQRYEDAAKLVTAGLNYAPNAERLIALQGQYQRELKQQRYLAGLAQITPATLDSLRRTLASFRTEVTGKRFQELEQRLHDNLLGEVQALEKRDFGAAEQLLGRARQLFPEVTAYSGYQLDRSVAARATAIRRLKSQIDQQNLAETLDMAAQVQQLQRTLPADDYRDLVNHTVSRTASLLGAELGRDPRTAAPLLRRAQTLWPEEASIQQLQLPAGAEPAKTVASASGGRSCTSSLAGYGARSRAVCYDMLGDQLRAPYMVVLPQQQGAPQLAISKFEVSVSDFNLFCSLSGQCAPLSAEGQHPASGLSLSQVDAYARWLSSKTGSTYRLPSLNEWQYAAKATGVQPQDYNCRLTQGDTVLKGWSLLEVKAGKANDWGLVNYLGNVQELVTQAGQTLAVGGHHKDKMSECSISLRRTIAEQPDQLTGFRLVKELPDV